MQPERPTPNWKIQNSTSRETLVCEIEKMWTCFENTLGGWKKPRLILFTKPHSQIIRKAPTVHRMLVAKPRGDSRRPNWIQSMFWEFRHMFHLETAERKVYREMDASCQREISILGGLKKQLRCRVTTGWNLMLIFRSPHQMYPLEGLS